MGQAAGVAVQRYNGHSWGFERAHELRQLDRGVAGPEVIRAVFRRGVFELAPTPRAGQAAWPDAGGQGGQLASTARLLVSLVANLRHMGWSGAEVEVAQLARVLRKSERSIQYAIGRARALGYLVTHAQYANAPAGAGAGVGQHCDIRRGKARVRSRQRYQVANVYELGFTAFSIGLASPRPRKDKGKRRAPSIATAAAGAVPTAAEQAPPAVATSAAAVVEPAPAAAVATLGALGRVSVQPLAFTSPLTPAAATATLLGLVGSAARDTLQGVQSWRGFPSRFLHSSETDSGGESARGGCQHVNQTPDADRIGEGVGLAADRSFPQPLRAALPERSDARHAGFGVGSAPGRALQRAAELQRSTGDPELAALMAKVLGRFEP